MVVLADLQIEDWTVGLGGAIDCIKHGYSLCDVPTLGILTLVHMGIDMPQVYILGSFWLPFFSPAVWLHERGQLWLVDLLRVRVEDHWVFYQSCNRAPFSSAPAANPRPSSSNNLSAQPGGNPSLISPDTHTSLSVIWMLICKNMCSRRDCSSRLWLPLQLIGHTSQIDAILVLPVAHFFSAENGYTACICLTVSSVGLITCKMFFRFQSYLSLFIVLNII